MNFSPYRSYWHDSRAPGSHAYLWPVILPICRRHGVKSVLDVGCGNGTFCEVLREEGIDAVGMEPSDRGYEVAKEKLGEKGVYHAGLEDGPESMPMGGFDAVISTEVVEHLYSPAILPQFAAAKVRQGGLFIVSAPYHGYMKNLLISLKDGWDRHHHSACDGGHIKFWSYKTLRSLLESNGFAVIEFHGAGRIPYLWKSMVIVGRKI